MNVGWGAVATLSSVVPAKRRPGAEPGSIGPNLYFNSLIFLPILTG